MSDAVERARAETETKLIITQKEYRKVDCKEFGYEDIK